MIKSKKQMFIVIGAFVLVMLLGTVTYAFFNYTRTGSANTIKTGRISFNSTQGQAINLTNLFPIDVTNGIPNDATKVGSVTINVTGDTTYTGGIEYLVSAVNVQNTVGSGANAKSLPISIDVSYTANGSGKVIGTEDEEYFDNRGGNTSLYRVLAKDTIEDDDQLVVGYIAKGATGVDGNIVIRAYLDASKIAISDTYPEEETDTNNDGYLDGTTSTWVGDRTVFTTTEWNSLQANGISFQIKVESNEGTWVEENRTINVMNTFPAVITGEKANIKEVYFNKMGATRMQQSYDAATIKADLTYNNEGKVLAWLEPDTQDNTKYIMYIASDGDTYLTNGEALFYNWSNVEKFEFNNLSLSRITSMEAMFANCSSLVSLDLSNMGGDNLSNYMSYTFNGCTNLQEINMSGFNFGSARLSGTFSNLSNLQTINLSGANTTRVTDMSPLFSGCSSLTSIDLSGLGGANLSNVMGMFSNCTNLEEVNMSGFNFGTADLGGLFAVNLSKLEVVDLSDAIINTQSMSGMFATASALNTIYVSNTWNVDNVANSSGMFSGCTSLVGGNGTIYDGNNPTDKTYARIDGGPQSQTPGYLTLKTN